ncbi:hypothetical protein AGLY_001762, partial [Aphis glycines]
CVMYVVLFISLLSAHLQNVSLVVAALSVENIFCTFKIVRNYLFDADAINIVINNINKGATGMGEDTNITVSLGAYFNEIKETIMYDKSIPLQYTQSTVIENIKSFGETLEIENFKNFVKEEKDKMMLEKNNYDNLIQGTQEPAYTQLHCKLGKIPPREKSTNWKLFQYIPAHFNFQDSICLIFPEKTYIVVDTENEDIRIVSGMGQHCDSPIADLRNIPKFTSDITLTPKCINKFCYFQCVRQQENEEIITKQIEEMKQKQVHRNTETKNKLYTPSEILNENWTKEISNYHITRQLKDPEEYFKKVILEEISQPLLNDFIGDDWKRNYSSSTSPHFLYVVKSSHELTLLETVLLMTILVITPNCIIIDFFDRLSGIILDPLLNSLRLSVSFTRSLQGISFEVLRSETGMCEDQKTTMVGFV